MRYLNTQTEFLFGKEATNKRPKRTYGKTVKKSDNRLNLRRTETENQSIHTHVRI